MGRVDGVAYPVPESLIVIFDGRCGMCTRTVEWLVARDKDARIEPIPCQTKSSVERFGLSLGQCERSVWAIAPGGEMASGAQAAMLIVAVLWQRAWPIRMWQRPVIRHVLSAGYTLVARHRHHFPGTTPWCETHPAACFPTCDLSCKWREGT